MQSHANACEIEMKDLIALKARAEAFILPATGKKATVGFGSTYSPFKSRGLDFQEVRVYQPGDDIRQIDWHVTAKYGKPFTKLYTEEKERTIFFVVDLRSNMHFATHGDFKHVIAARMAAFMAFIAGVFMVVLSITSAISTDTGRRRKEVALRKIHGARASDIAKLFILPYIVITVIAFAVGWIIAESISDLLGSVLWIRILPWHGLIVFIFIVAVIALSTFWKVRRIMRTNPAEVIKNE